MVRLFAKLRADPRVELLTRTLRRFVAHGGQDLAASVTFFAIFSLFPLLLGLIAIFSLFVDSAEVQDQILTWVATTFPAAEDLARSNLEAIVRSRGTLGIVSLVGLFWSASAMFRALARALNRAWDVTVQRSFVRQRLVGLAMAMSVGVLFIVSVLATSAVELLVSVDVPWVREHVGDLSTGFDALNWMLGLGIQTATFALLYKLAPNAEIGWRQVLPGALFAAIAFELGKRAFVWYLSSFANFEAVYGPLGSVIALLFWALISAQIVILGAELAKARVDMVP